jgi:predicted PurR-regulated permease PerM
VLKLELSYRGALFAGLAVLTLIALIRLWPVVVLVLSAFIFMAALLPYVNWLVRRGIPRTAAVLLIFLGIVAVIAGLLALVVPAMIDEFQDIRDNLPEDARRLEEFLDDFGINVELEERARDVDWGEVLSGREAVDYGQRAIVAVLSIFTVLVLTAYLLIDTPRLTRFVYQWVPAGREPEFERILASLGRVVGGYVRGQAITSVCIAVYTLVVLLILGVPNAVAFAVLAGFADIIPLIGAFIATIPPVIAAFDVTPTRALIVLVLLLIYQQFEDRYLTPRVYGSTLNLPPLIVLLAILVGGELFGITGVLLALPAAAVGRVAMDYVLDARKAAIAPPGPVHEPAAPDNQPTEA